MSLTRQEQRQRVAALLATPTKAAAPDAKALLDAANSASQTVAVLHVAFMAVCAYVLVIVFGTTDLDLLMGGNNVKLPVIDVAVPIVGFYAFAPYLVVLMHLNLLLQLQLLSRKLFAFDAVTPAEEGVGGLRDRLHIFPYTYYLVGRPNVVVGGLLGLVVSVTLIVLPLATLLALQLRFLAYQAEGITWAQRVAVFLDVGLLVALWPVILHPRDDWKAWWRETLAAYLPKKRTWLAVVALLASVAIILFAATPDIFTVGLILGAAAPLLLIVLVGHLSDERTRRAIISFAVLLGLLAVLWALIWVSKNSLPSVEPAIPVALFLGVLPLSFFWHPKAPRGSLALLSALALTPLLTLGLMVDGEGWEAATTEAQRPLFDWRMLGRQEKTLAKQFEFEEDKCMPTGQTVLSCVVLAEQRRLDLDERALFAKPPSPELLAALRAGKGLENKDKLERISLVGRSLRRAKMQFVLLVGADLRHAQLQGASLSEAQLQGADLGHAQLQGADLGMARLQGADLKMAELQGADLGMARLQGADLGMAELQGADLEMAELQGADLGMARLQGADLGEAQLQGANLGEAQLQGANLGVVRSRSKDLTLRQWYRRNLKVKQKLEELPDLKTQFDAQLDAQLRSSDIAGALESLNDFLDEFQGGAQLQGADLKGAQLQGADLKGALLYQNGDPRLSDLLDIRETAVRPLSHEKFSKIHAMLESIPDWNEKKQKNLRRRLELAIKLGATVPTFTSCVADQNSQPKCQQAYDGTNLNHRDEFVKRLHGVLVMLACEDIYTAHGILRQIPNSDGESDSTRAGLATVFLKRMKENPPCPGLAGLSAEDKKKLGELAKKEAERERAAKAASAGQR